MQADIFEYDYKKYKSQRVALSDYDEAFSPFLIENIPLSPKDTKMDVSWLSLEGLSVIQRKTSGEIFQYGRSLDNAFTFFLPGAHFKSIDKFLNNHSDQSSSFIVGPGQQDKRIIAGGGHNFAMAFEVESLARLLSRSELEQLHDKGPLLDKSVLDSAVLRQASTQLGWLFDNLDLDSKAQQVLLENAILNLVLSFKLSDDDRQSTSQRSRSFAKAVEYIKCNYTQPISIADIANSSCTTVRNLQYIFKKAMNLSPMHFLRCYRLYKFQEYISMYKKVEQAALACGFNHIGRASSYYKTFYDMSPSAYLATQHQSNFYSWLSREQARNYVA